MISLRVVAKPFDTVPQVFQENERAGLVGWRGPNGVDEIADDKGRICVGDNQDRSQRVLGYRILAIRDFFLLVLEITHDSSGRKECPELLETLPVIISNDPMTPEKLSIHVADGAIERNACREKGKDEDCGYPCRYTHWHCLLR
jgi:hypothetical protein